MMKLQRRITKVYFDLAVNKYAPLINQLAFRIGVDNTQVEEMKSQAKEELLRCMICYYRSGSFITFFYGRLSGVFRHMRDTEYRARRVQIIPLDAMSTITGPYVDVDIHILVEELMTCLSDKERDIVYGLFFEDKTMREISRDQGIVVSTIHRIKHRAMDKMRQKCEMGCR